MQSPTREYTGILQSTGPIGPRYGPDATIRGKSKRGRQAAGTKLPSDLLLSSLVSVSLYDEVTDAGGISRYYIRACRVMGYHVDARDAEMEKDKLEKLSISMLPWRLGLHERGDHYKRGHLSYWCDPEGEDVHDCSMQKTIMLKDGQYGHWKVRMKLLVRGINDAAWIAVKTRQEEPTIFTAEGKKPKPKEPRQGVVREVVQEVVQRMRQSLMEERSSDVMIQGVHISLGRRACVCQRVNQDACRVVETMWMQYAELSWNKLEEQVYTVEKRQEINLGSKFMP
ncbi:hypothetical protein F2Q69_00015067 [Brassica cretica]|uniref:Uncharacterized protein n=1 Tax=Brassica cretica TaxID=69181 RepID=A0A8S9QJW5_BRACR|nr:hypothetical protein F2Q69_00015067 [Brassica cretica]